MNRFHKILIKWLLALVILLASSSLVNAQNFRLYGNNTRGFIPFNFPVNYSSFRPANKNHISYTLLGTGGPLGHLEYAREIMGKIYLGIGIGYPHIAGLIGIKKRILNSRELRLMFRGGTYPGFYNISSIISSTKQAKKKYSFNISYHYTRGNMSWDMISNLDSYFPASKVVSLNWNTHKSISKITVVHFSLGYCLYGVLFDRCSNKLMDGDWSEYKGCPDPEWKWENGWTTSFAIEHSF